MKGLAGAKEVHEQSGGNFYKNFKLEKNGHSAVVRVLEPETEWHSFHIHQLWDNATKKFLVRPTRCPSEAVKRDPENCALCALGDQVQRQFKTYIPVLIRPSKDFVGEYTPEVFIVAYGSKGLNPVENVIEELPEGINITMLDIRIKRVGDGLATTYYWNPIGSPRALNADEAALEIPDMEEAWQVPTRIELDRSARTFTQSTNVRPVSTSDSFNDDNFDSELPF